MATTVFGKAAALRQGSRALLVCLAGCVAAMTSDAGDLRAGAARVDITPPAAHFPYTAQRERPFVGIHDDLYARALVLDDGKRRVALVVVDVTRLPEPEGLVKAVAKEIGQPESNVLIAATHTHNAPLVFFHDKEPDAIQAAELAQLRSGVLDAVHQAKAQLQPARLAFGRGSAYVNVNNGEQAGLVKWQDPKGPSDKALDVLRVQKADGAPLALLVNYSTHAEVMFRSATKDGGYEVSGDFPGAVAHMLETQPSGAPVVLYAPGAEADQLTLFKSLQPAGHLPAADEGAGGWALLDVQARRLSEAVMDTLEALPPGDSQVHLDAAAGQVSCPGQRTQIDRQTGAVSVTDAPPVDIPLSMIRINDIVLGGVGGDVASEIGQHFKSGSPVRNSTLISMANDSLGYLLTDASYLHPGHAVNGSPLKPGCAESAIVDGLIHLIAAKK